MFHIGNVCWRCIALHCIIISIMMNTLVWVFTAKLLRQGYRYLKLRKAFSKFYCRHSTLVENIASV